MFDRGLSALSITTKSLLIVVVSVTALIALAMTILPAAKEFAIEREIAKVRALTEVARNVAIALDEQAKQGLISDEEARSRFYELASSMCYDDKSNYIFVLSDDGKMLAHPNSKIVVSLPRTLDRCLRAFSGYDPVDWLG